VKSDRLNLFEMENEYLEQSHRLNLLEHAENFGMIRGEQPSQRLQSQEFLFTNNDLDKSD